MFASNTYSKLFFELVKAIGESTGKQSQDEILNSQKYRLKSRLKDEHMTSREMKEWILSALYCEMLGHDASFAFIPAVKLAQTPDSVIAKRTGYLFCSLCLEDESQYKLLLVNTIAKDLGSQNWMNVISGLIVCAYLRDANLVLSLSNDIFNLIKCSNSTVRRRAYLTCYGLHDVIREPPMEYTSIVSRALADPDPLVMAASLPFVYRLADKADNEWIEAILPALINILDQVVIKNALPREYEYSRMPAPWVQARLFECIIKMASKTCTHIEQIKCLFKDVFTQFELHSSNIAYGLMYELSRCICAIGFTELASVAKATATSFLQSDSEVLLYCGISLTKEITRVDDEYPKTHAVKIINALKHSNQTVRRMALSLVTELTSPANITLVSGKLLDAMTTCYDAAFEKLLAESRTIIAEQYSPSVSWYLQSVVLTMMVSKSLSPKRIPSTVYSLISQGPSEGHDQAADTEFRVFALEFFIKLFKARTREWVVPSVPEELTICCLWLLSSCDDVMSGEGGRKAELVALRPKLMEWCGRYFNELESTTLLNTLCLMKVLGNLSDSKNVPTANENKTNTDLLDRYTGASDKLVDDETYQNNDIMDLLEKAHAERNGKCVLWNALYETYYRRLSGVVEPICSYPRENLEAALLAYAKNTSCPEYREESVDREMHQWIIQKQLEAIPVIKSHPGSYSARPSTVPNAMDNETSQYIREPPQNKRNHIRIPATESQKPIWLRKKKDHDVDEDEEAEREAKILFG